MEKPIIPKCKHLTSIQQEIVGSTEYPMYLRAGAGTGKTEVLVQKVLHILKTEPDISLANFAIITFTNKATEEMQGRIASALFSQWLSRESEEDTGSGNLEIVNMVDICTIHSFCERLIQRFGLQINVAPNFKIKSFKKETANIISAVVNKYCGAPLLSGVPSYAIEKLVSVFLANNSNRGIHISEEVANALSHHVPNNHYWNAFKSLFLDIYSQVEIELRTAKKEKNVVTPNDLIWLAADLLRIPNIANRVAQKYRYIFIDEFQDTNKDQFNLVDSLIHQGVKVFLVGDDKQSIYAFRGADVQNSQEMHTLIHEQNKNGTEECLSENFRSTKEVIAVINDVFSYAFKFNGDKLSFPREPLRIPSGSPSEPNIPPIKFEFEKPVKDIVQEILSTTRIRGNPVQYGDIAILCRRNFDLDRIASELKAAGIPICVVGGKGFYKTQEVIDTYKLLAAIIYNSETAMNEVRFTDYSRSTTHEGIYHLIVEMQDFIRIETMVTALTQLYERSGILNYYRSHRKYQAASNLLKLSELAQTLTSRDNMQPIQFLEYLRIMISTNQEEDEAEIPERERMGGVVSLYSIHKAKGLSFPIVVIPCCDNKLNRPITKPKIILDLKSAQPAIGFLSETISESLSPDSEYTRMLEANVKEQLEEEIRVFYVACTRAERQIVIASTGSKQQVLQSRMYTEYASISRWLAEMEKIR